jgi:hypothetical protein
MQLATLGIAILSGLVLVLLPARLLAGRAGRGLPGRTAAHFLLIGTGFMHVEIAAMQRLVLLLGDPAHALAVTFAAFLAFAGLGSGAAARLQAPEPCGGRPWAPGPGLVLLAVAGLAALHALAWPWLLAPGGGPGPAARAVLEAAMIAPLAFAMGMPFPLALARLRTTAPALVPWAWGVISGSAAAGVQGLGSGRRGLAERLSAPIP